MRQSKTLNVLSLVAAAGLAATAAQSAKAQAVVNISGATLFENFFKAQASTNDFIDVDGNGTAGKFANGVQDLAPYFLPPNPGAGQWWAVQYHAAGSGNGLAEFVSFGQTFVQTADGVDMKSSNYENAYYNRNKWKDLATGLQAIANTGNGGASPVTSDLLGTRVAQYAAPNTHPANSGVRIDLAVMDVPTGWFVITSGGTPNFTLKPGIAGYGNNPANAVTVTGGTTSQNNKLKSLGALNLNVASPNANTVYDTQVAFVPISAITNLGTGYSEITVSRLRHLQVTGRSECGENLVVCTRDSGSGTRNGFMSSLCLDPSWGVGDNVGVKNDGPAFNILGPDFLPCNKGGSGSMESTVQNHRLAIGHTGTERGSGWLLGGRMEMMAVKFDLDGGTEYVRPNIDAILDNGIKGQADPSGGTYAHDGYRIGGPETFASIGDPLAAPVAKGGLNNGNPAMANVEAAAYLNNITQSIANFVSVPGGSQSLFMPGELLASSFILTAATDKVQQALDGCTWSNNGALNQPLQDYLRANNQLGQAAYGTFGTVTTTGKVPSRKTGLTYSDGVVNGLNYKDQAGNPIFYGDNLNSRNRISGDFNNDGARNLDDAFEQVDAFMNPGSWQSGTDACREILGDYNGDGNFDLKDLRYWADGLAMDATCVCPCGEGAVLNRYKGFRALDDNHAALGGTGNIFGTTLAHGTYASGASAADVAGAAGVAPGWAPVGSDGTVDAKDIDYVYKQFRQNAHVMDGQLNWCTLDEAVGGDLSCDINGDLAVDQKDICQILAILGCQFGDVNLDGSVDATDRGIITNPANFNLPGGWAKGDIDGSGTVDQADLDAFDLYLATGFGPCCPADFDANGFVNGDDFDAFTVHFDAGDCLADFDLNGFTNGDDFDAFAAFFNAGC